MSKTTSLVLVLSTAPNLKVARKLAKALVQEKLAACVNLVPVAASVYRWKGKLCEESEVLLLCKTRRSKTKLLSTRLKSLHPYELPELIVLSIDSGDSSYLRWLALET